MRNQTLTAIAIASLLLKPAIAEELPQINDERAHQRFEFQLTYDVDFSAPNSLDPKAGFLRREDMGVSNNAGQHRQGPGRRHAAWYDKYHDQTASVENGVLIQRGFVADSDLPGFVSRDAGDSPRNFSYVDPDPKDAARGEVNFADFEIHTSWFDTFALKNVEGEQVPVDRTDEQVPKDQFWGQPGKTDTASPNITFAPGTFFEIEVNFEGMEALAHRHSFWLMPAAEQSGAYDDDPSNGLEIDIYEHEMVVEKDAPEAESRNNILLMKCIGGKTNPPTTFNELRDDGKTSIQVPGINQGWHKIGLFWTEQALIWFVDGKAVVRDSKLVPTVPMYLIVSREANTGAGLSSDHQNLRADGERIPVDAGLYGRNVATPTNRDLIKQGRDEVRVRSIRAWTIQPRQ
ncbi:MAG: lichenase [Rhodopirellula sp. JB055]|uniref:lichenase n=1 Tax=Rhodopirellula sp. JB055 TaxID=3342846 RepID=UPI00370AD820